MNRYTPPRNEAHSKHESDIDTRNPTTHQKMEHSPPFFRRSNPLLHPPPVNQEHPTRSLSEHILRLESCKERYMMSREYSKAERVAGKIKRAKSQLAEVRLNRLLQYQRREKRSISEAHKQEMNYFEAIWSRYFTTLSKRQSTILRSFKNEQKRQLFEAQGRVKRRCRSLQSHSREIIDLKDQEMRVRKTNNFSYLKYIKTQMAQQERKERKKIEMSRRRLWELEEERVAVAQSKKYTVLIGRLEEYRQDKERVYLREQKRLRQKYRNVMQQLRHDQTMEMEESKINFEMGY